MKKKIIALVLVLLLIPSVLLAASTKYTKTEKVIYNPINVTYEGENLNSVIKIGNNYYVSLNESPIFGDKIKATNLKNGDIYFSTKNHEGFMFNIWGDSIEAIKKIMMKQPDNESNNSLTYSKVYSVYSDQDCSAKYFLENNELQSGQLTYLTTDKESVTFYESVVREVYNEFDSIVFKDAYLPNNCPNDIEWSNAIKDYGAYMYAKFQNDTDTAYITLKYDNVKGFLVTIDFAPKD